MTNGKCFPLPIRELLSISLGGSGAPTRKEMPTMYKPNFCVECGARIERKRWRLWTSRRFCPDCEKRFQKSRLVLPLMICATLVSIGFVVGRARRPAPPPVIIERSQLSALAPSQAASQPAGANAERINAPQPAEPRYGPSGTANERPTDPNEIVSICGARTKKGTPCSRRVRGTGRCWQHRGKPAMLPPAKLIVPA